MISVGQFLYMKMYPEQPLYWGRAGWVSVKYMCHVYPLYAKITGELLVYISTCVAD